MLNHPTHEKLNQLKLFGMAHAFAEQGALDLDHLGFEERLGMLVDREVTECDGRLLAQRLLRAKLKPNTAAKTPITAMLAAWTRRCSSGC